jgi:hypothetical protein
MTVQDTPMKPQETVIYLLGELKGQVVSLQGSVDSSQATQAGINASVQTEIASMRRDIGTLSSEVGVLKAQMPRRAPWWSVAAGVASIAAVLVVAIQLFTNQ